MKEPINSSYNYKEIFSFLPKIRSFNIVIYNKQIQNKLDIGIKDYQKLSKRYKIGEKNGKGKEYDSYYRELIFEGEYLNGKRNGKGKEYCFGTLEFEGEYLNGKRNGKGKEYYEKDKLRIFKWRN